MTLTFEIVGGPYDGKTGRFIPEEEPEQVVEAMTKAEYFKVEHGDAPHNYRLVEYSPEKQHMVLMW